MVLEVAGDDDGTLGTDGGRIADAIRAADGGAGVVVLADIGSAILSVRAVLNDDMVDGVTAVLADAPLVEGAIAAAVTASIGGDVESVRAAAEEAWNVRKL
jgi:PTS hybrid protein